MPDYLKALEISTEQNIADFSVFLWQNKIPHRINEEAGVQVLWVTNEADRKSVIDAYEKLCTGKLVLRRVDRGNQHLNKKNRFALLQLGFNTPVTLLAIILSIFGALVYYYRFSFTGELFYWSTFQPQVVINGQVKLLSAQQAYQEGEYWRLITPIFLHFGMLHVVFNSLWIWELGKRIEFAKGSMTLAGIILLIGIGSNIGQYLWQTQNHQIANFGGMSGVVYGLLGYIWLVNRFSPQVHYMLPPGLMIFMMAWLVLCMTDIFSIFGSNTEVANAAHVCGLLMGLLLAAGNLVLTTRVDDKS